MGDGDGVRCLFYATRAAPAPATNFFYFRLTNDLDLSNNGFNTYDRSFPTILYPCIEKFLCRMLKAEPSYTPHHTHIPALLHSCDSCTVCLPIWPVYTIYDLRCSALFLFR